MSNLRSHKYILVIAGATAVGKTRLAMGLAESLGTEIISADSRQIYKELQIGVAKPSWTEMQRVHHHLVSEISIHDTFDVAVYERMALDRLDQLFGIHDIVVVEGGSGLHLRALLEGMDDIPGVSAEIEAILEARYATEGLEPLLEELSRRDQCYYDRVDRSNPRRVLRALGVCMTMGRPFSDYLKRGDVSRSFRAVCIHVTRPRADLYARINARVDSMVEAGLEDEAKSFYPHRHLRALQTVGYQEWYPYIEGDYNRERAIELIKRNSRRYAKRQLTWFRNQGEWTDMEVDSPDIQERILDMLPT